MHFIMSHVIIYIVTLIGYSLITIIFKNEQEKYLALAEVATGVGLAIGPVIGSFIFEFFGYEYTFIMYGGILLVSIIPLLIFVPKKPNRMGYSRSR
jgi:MFS family permease